MAKQHEDESRLPAVRTKLNSALEAIDARLANHKKVVESTNKTNLEFKWNIHSPNSIRIDKTDDVRLLIGMLGYIKHQEERYELAAKDLKLENYPAFDWCGYTYEDWKHDINIRVTILNSEKELKELSNAKKELEGFLTKEDQLEITLRKLGFGSDAGTEDQTEDHK